MNLLIAAAILFAVSVLILVIGIVSLRKASYFKKAYIQQTRLIKMQDEIIKNYRGIIASYKKILGEGVEIKN